MAQETGLPGGLSAGADGRVRCAWQGGHADYAAYHDTEWGRPQGDPRRLFEKLVLEGFQSGLSWLTILRKRAAFRAAFADFDYGQVARYGPDEVERLLADRGIVRHRGKIEAAIANARAATALEATSGPLEAFLWAHAPPPGDTSPTDAPPTTTPAATALARALKARGFRFVGPTTAYAFMQAVGMVNDHRPGCWCRADVEAARHAFAAGRLGA